MAICVSEAQPRPPFIAFLARELAPREGRGLAVTRIAAATTLTVAIAMVFRIPLAAYMAYLVFLISKDDREATTITAVGGALAVTFAVIFTLGLSLVDLGDPAVRLPAMALITFLAMFSVRTFALGPVSFLAGFIVVTMQSVIDEVPNTETFTRTALWLWVVVVVPVVITVLIDLLFGPGPSTAAAGGLRKVLAQLGSALTRGDVSRQLPHWRTTLQSLIAKAESPAAVWRLLDALVILEQYPDPIPAPERERLSALVGQCLRSLEHAEVAVTAPLSAESLPPAPAGVDVQWPARLAATEALQGFEHEIQLSQSRKSGPAGHKQRRMFVPDALSNPAHWQFALKTTLAVMIVYAVYSMLDWPGLRTSIVTCFFVALGSLGETVHKLSLRLSGAVIGGLIAGLSIVFVLPHFTDIGQLSVLTAVVALFAGWVATSSERLSYAGLQIAFAFFLGLLQTYAPATDLTVLRDRVVGILLGNIVIAVVFSALWPESAMTRLRTALADALGGIAAVLRSPGERTAARQRTIEALVRADQFETLSRFELEMLHGEKAPAAHLPALHSVERLAAAAFVATSDPVTRAVDVQTVAPLAQWLDAAASATAERRAAPALASFAPMNGDLQGAAAAQLRTEMDRVAATAQ
ncbi:MAG TPA: FUSC family protein [Steroidobacteraceae bacterium]|nr:FUSC family protein [Steroidobacteraceae bacterium]